LALAVFGPRVCRMQAAAQNDFVRAEDYLAAEETSEVRHEYLGGLVYAMAGETTTHNQIAGNLYLAARQRLKGKPCRVFMSDIRVNFDLRNDQYFYYPDIVVTCDKRDTHPRFVRYPKLIIEVLSESTERVDRREKFFAYTSIASLEEYVLVAQAPCEVTIFRRGNNWKAEKVSGMKGKIALESLKASVSLAAIYEGVSVSHQATAAANM
jgi:Uma2 family endonuclease